MHFDTPDQESSNIPYPQVYERMKSDAREVGGEKLARFVSRITDTTDGQTYLTADSWSGITKLWNKFEAKESIPTEFETDFYKFEELAKETTRKLRRLRVSQEHMRWQFGFPEWYEAFIHELNDTKEGWVSSNC